jgi:Rrf2 family protein
LVQNWRVRITAKADYAVRAALELAAAGSPMKGDDLASAQRIPLKFLENILIDLRNSGIVRSQRGPEGGYWLAKAADEVSVADVIRAVEGPLASVRGESPEELEYVGAAEQLQDVWVALRTSLRGVLETVTLEDVVRGRLPKKVLRLTEQPGAWARR